MPLRKEEWDPAMAHHWSGRRIMEHLWGLQMMICKTESRGQKGTLEGLTG